MNNNVIDIQLETKLTLSSFKCQISTWV